MSAIFDTTLAFFNGDGWPVQVLEEDQVIGTQFRGENDQWNCFVEANQEKNQLVFYSVCRTNVPTEKRQSMAEFLTRANFGLIIGNFEMDYRDGQVRYKTSLDVEDTTVSETLVRNMVYANVTLMGHYLPGVMKVIYSNLTPLQILEEIEA